MFYAGDEPVSYTHLDVYKRQVFVLITLMAAALSAREGELVSLTLLTDRFPEKLRKPSVLLITALNLVFTSILFGYGMDKVITQLENGKRTFVLNWPEWIFWSFVPIDVYKRQRLQSEKTDG